MIFKDLAINYTIHSNSLMKYEEAVTIVQSAYTDQAESLISSLAPAAIIVLAKLSQNNIQISFELPISSWWMMNINKKIDF